MRPSNASVRRVGVPPILSLEIWRGPRINGRSGHNWQWVTDHGDVVASGWSAGTRREARAEAEEQVAKWMEAP